ncbi:hypothetical protein BDZ89DRAFT_1061104, partial [Hymenopellis radicata]
MSASPRLAFFKTVFICMVVTRGKYESDAGEKGDVVDVVNGEETTSDILRAKGRISFLVVCTNLTNGSPREATEGLHLDL